MVILAPENGARKLLPPDPAPIQLTQAQIIKRNADALRRSKAASWTRAANAQAAAAFAGSRVPVAPQPTGGTAGGAGKNTTPPRPAAIIMPPALPPPPPSVPPPIAKVPRLPPLPSLPPPPLPPRPGAPNGRAPGIVAGGGGAPGGGILLVLGLALLASFGKRQ